MSPSLVKVAIIYYIHRPLIWELCYMKCNRIRITISAIVISSLAANDAAWFKQSRACPYRASRRLQQAGAVWCYQKASRADEYIKFSDIKIVGCKAKGSKWQFFTNPLSRIYYTTDVSSRINDNLKHIYHWEVWMI